MPTKSKAAKVPAKATPKRKLVRFLPVEQHYPITTVPGFHIKEDDSMKVHTPVAVVMFPQGCTKTGDPGYDRQRANALLLESAPNLLRCVRLATRFLDSLPDGWLAKTVADIGALNQFYLSCRPVLRKLDIFAD